MQYRFLKKTGQRRGQGRFHRTRINHPKELSALRAGLKDERPTSNVQHRILNKVFCQFINRQSTSVPQHKLTDFIHAKAWFDVQKNSPISYDTEFIRHKMEISILSRYPLWALWQKSLFPKYLSRPSAILLSFFHDESPASKSAGTGGKF